MKHADNSSKRWYVVLLLFIITLGLLPRAVELLSHNYLFGYDQGLFFEKVKSIVVDHKWTLIGEEVGGGGGFFQGPGFYYVLAIPFALTGGDPYAAMVLFFLVGAATLILATLLVSQSLGWQEAIFVIFFMAVSPAMVAQSRFIWNPFFVPLISVGIFFLVYRVLKGFEAALIALFFCIGLLFHFEIATGIMMFGAFSLFTLFWWLRKVVRGRFVLYALVSFLLTQSTFIVFDIRHNFLITKGLWTTFLGRPESQLVRISTLQIYFNHWDVFRHNLASTFPNGDFLWPVIGILATVGVVQMVRDRHVDTIRKQFIVFLYAFPFMMFLLFMKYLSPMWEWWLLELGVVYTLVVGLVFSWGWQKDVWWRIIISVVVGLFLFSHIRSTMAFYRSDYADYGGTHKIRGKIDAIDALYRDANGRPFNLLVFTPPVYTYPYDYLIWWHGRRRYGYVPGKEKRGMFYLLIERDPEKPWSYQGWKETVIKPGKPEMTQELPSGFIIEKYTANSL